MGSGLRFVFIAISGVLLYFWLLKPTDHGQAAQIDNPPVVVPSTRAPYQYCEIKTDLFRAQLTTRGATLKRFELTTPKYEKDGHPHDVSTTPQPGAVPNSPSEDDPNAAADQIPGTAHEFRQQLFTQFNSPTSAGLDPNAKRNVQFDSFDWKLESSGNNVCTFVYQDDSVKLKKQISTTSNAYELQVETTIENISSEPRAHAFAIDTVAWWLDKDVASHMFRVSPFVTNVECVGTDGTAVRKHPDAFEPGKWEEPGFHATGHYRWFQVDAPPAFASVSNAYFSHAIVPVTGPSVPLCQLQVEPRRGGGEPGSFYRARLAYPARNLEPGKSETYKILSYIGPKERSVLSLAGDGKHRLEDLIDLGFFAFIAKFLVDFLLWVYGIIPNWGVAIIVLTLCARILLFPLAIPGIRTMLRMRDLRPELDALNEKYKDDVRAKGAAQMELFRKHGMSPFDQIKGCLPQLATMPVWFALYTTLQTAVELYNIPFLWFPDLSAPDPYFVLPFIIGATYFAQQKIMPFQGDPAQRKMMLYFMPGMFTVFMLFLPAGLGVYMFTNSILAIFQQQAVESHAQRSTSRGKLAVEAVTEGPSSKQLEGKPKARRS
jgi:YidC/Oxa1 family membrane protein insertase